MEITYFLLPVALLLSFTSLCLFVWALRNGQFDDLEGPRWRILFDDRVDPRNKAQPPLPPDKEDPEP